MIRGNDIRELRKAHGLTQLQLGRAVFLEECTISNYESDKRVPSIETLEKIANVFGHTVELSLIQKKGTSKDVNFYKEKTYSELASLSNEDLTDYIFITQSDLVLANLCNLNENIIKSLPLSSLRDLIKASVDNLDIKTIYYKLNYLHEGVEEDVSILVDEIKEYLKNNEDIPNDIVDKVCYIDLDLYGDINCGEMEVDCMRLLDKDKNDLGIEHDDIMKDGEIPLFSECQTYELLYHIKQNPILQLEY